MLAAADLRQDSFWVAFIVQAFYQPYELSQIVPTLRYAHMQITEKNMRSKKVFHRKKELREMKNHFYSVMPKPSATR
jgi:hypothetical protein